MAVDATQLNESLSAYIDFEVDAALLSHILRANPALAEAGAEFGWDDTEVKEQLAVALSLFLTGLPWPTYGDRADVDTHHELVLEAFERLTTS
jgi:hypothetical protein